MTAHPRAYRAWTICRIPVFGPLLAQYAGGIQDIAVKNTIHNIDVLRSNANNDGPSMPSENCKCLSL